MPTPFMLRSEHAMAVALGPWLNLFGKRWMSDFRDDSDPTRGFGHCRPKRCKPEKHGAILGGHPAQTD